MERERVLEMMYADQTNFTKLKERWKARREQKRHARYASSELSDVVLRDIGINRSQIMAAELAAGRS
jgi:uncharacterized protein YjiS (DUF1127 family)